MLQYYYAAITIIIIMLLTLDWTLVLGWTCLLRLGLKERERTEEEKEKKVCSSGCANSLLQPPHFISMHPHISKHRDQ